MDGGVIQELEQFATLGDTVKREISHKNTWKWSGEEWRDQS